MSAATPRARRTRLIVGGILGAAVLVPVTWAFASFFGSGSIGAEAAADVLHSPATPLAVRVARNAVITWSPSTTSDGVEATTYSVSREPSGGGSSTPVVCLTGQPFQCTEVNVPSGAWDYRVTAHLLSWDSTPSAPATVTIDAPAFTIAPGQTVKAGAAVLGGTFDNFQAGELVAVTAAPGGAVIGQATADANGHGTVAITAGTIGGTFTPTATGPSGTSATSPNDYVVDVVAPKTTATPAGSLGSNNWYTSDVVVTLTADDGSAEISYTVDGPSGPGAPQPYEGPFTLDTDGTYTVHYGAVDGAGNVETVHDLTLRIDSTAPVPGALTIPANIKGDFVFTMTATDPTPASGVASVSYLACTGTPCNDTLIGSSSVGPGYQVPFTTVPLDGSYKVRAQVTDAAGNTTLTARQNVLLDTKAPSGTIASPTGGGKIGGPAVTFTATAADPPALSTPDSSGVRNVVFEYRLVTTPASGWTQLRTLNAEPYSFTRSMLGFDNGDYELHIVVTDRSGNQFTSGPTLFTVENWGASSVVLNNIGLVPGRGLIQTGDQMIVIFEQKIGVASLCSAWAGDDSVQHLSVDAQLLDGGANPDRIELSTSSPCTPNAGSLLLGSGNYVTGTTVTFTGSDLSWNPATKQLVLTLGVPSGPVTKVDVSTNATYQPSNALLSVNGVPVNPRTIRTGPGRQF